MNNNFFRNNLYFKYDSLNKTLDLLVAFNNCLYNCKTKEAIFINNINSTDGVYTAPIDLLLYHIDKLEFLHHNYNEEEKKLRKDGLIPANTYRALKYTFYQDDIKELYEELQKIPISKVEIIIKAYKNYFLNEKKDPALRILSIATI